MPPRARDGLVLLLRLAVAALLVALLAYYASPAKIFEAIRAANVWLVLAVAPLMGVCMALGALQLKILTDCHGMNLELGQIVRINTTTEFYNLFLPGVLSGGAIRWYRLSRDNKQYVEALAVIATSRFLNLFVLLSLGVLGWLLEGGPRGPTAAFWPLAGALGAITAGAFAISQPRVRGAVRDGLAPRVWPSVRGRLQKGLDALGAYGRLRGVGRAQLMLYATIWQVVIIFSTLLFCLALGLSVPVLAIAWIRGLVGLALLLPITVSGFGVREAGWIYFLGFYGVEPAAAFALSVLLFLRTLFLATIGLGIEVTAIFQPGKA